MRLQPVHAHERVTEAPLPPVPILIALRQSSLSGREARVRDRSGASCVLDASSGDGTLGKQSLGPSQIGPRGFHRRLRLRDCRGKGCAIVAASSETRFESSQRLAGRYAIANGGQRIQ